MATATKPRKTAKAPNPDAESTVGLSVLRLNIKREFLDQIVAGSKKDEFRDASPHNIKLFCTLDEQKNPTGYRHYDLVHFYVERNADPYWANVEIKEIYADNYIDEQTGEDIPESEGGCFFGIKLGEVLAVKQD